ncbi:GNAT family N-acetyltransferase [Nesterenkonia haasae]|uniref:GNAT family N-acetyltransferase n=1 Tax=Nesterenkonia haasae TaxID=2587813 RepID=UPI0013910720|nr:GNAT family protein [Nesterenkonia haasae]NDK30849.1 GNAT family N-acetyltransferase [Nesterenkonia haasae]
MNSPFLRRLRVDDATAVLAGFQADSTDMSRQGEVTDLDSARQYITFVTDTAEGNHGFAVVADDDCVGVIGINGATQHRLGWFFYWIHPEFRGLRLGSAAASAAANWALTSREAGDGGFERLELGHRVNNPASGAIARSAGFIHEGTERRKFLIDGERIDVLTYGRLSTDPVPASTPLRMEV